MNSIGLIYWRRRKGRRGRRGRRRRGGRRSRRGRRKGEVEKMYLKEEKVG